jgi:repressor LexA
MTLQELISVYRHKHNLSLNDIAQAVGVNISSVSRWENGLVKNISKDKKDLLSQLFSIDVEDYLNHRFFKPVIGTVKAGYDYFANQDIQDYEEVSKSDYDRGDYYLRVKGDSMVGSRIYEGDLVLIQKSDNVDNGSLAIVMINGDEATLKRVIKKEDMLILEASNPSVPTRFFTPQEVEELPVSIIGKVINVKVDVS